MNIFMQFKDALTAEQARTVAETHEFRQLNNRIQEILNSSFQAVLRACNDGMTQMDLQIYMKRSDFEEILNAVRFETIRFENDPHAKDTNPNFHPYNDLVPQNQIYFTIVKTFVELGYKVDLGYQCYYGDSREEPKFYLKLEW